MHESAVQWMEFGSMEFWWCICVLEWIHKKYKMYGVNLVLYAVTVSATGRGCLMRSPPDHHTVVLSIVPGKRTLSR